MQQAERSTVVPGSCAMASIFDRSGFLLHTPRGLVDASADLCIWTTVSCLAPAASTAPSHVVCTTLGMSCQTQATVTSAAISERNRVVFALPKSSRVWWWVVPVPACIVSRATGGSVWQKPSLGGGSLLLPPYSCLALV